MSDVKEPGNANSEYARTHRRICVVIWLLITIGLQLFYKSKMALAGQISWSEVFNMLTWDAVFAMLLATILVSNHYLIATRLKFSGLVNGTSRAAARYGLAALTGIVLALLFSWAWLSLLWGYPTDPSLLVDLAVIAIALPLVINGMLETFHYHSEWRAEQLRLEAVSHHAMAAEFEALKNQLSPHFLFNSFATLTRMIHRDPPGAQAFVENLAEIYRYVLQSREVDSVALGDELQTVQAFLDVHEARFPGGLRVDVEVSQSDLDARIAPMTLYTLVENALKHNVVSPQQPLTIRVSIGDDQTLVVANTDQPRQVRHSTGAGLDNLNRRCKIAANRGLDVTRENGEFVVCAPLLRDNP